MLKNSELFLKNMDLTYTKVIVNFPGTISCDFLHKKPVFYGKRLDFVRNEYRIRADLYPYCLPIGISSSHPIVQKNIIQPGVELVSNDLRDIDNLLPNLVELAEKGIVNESLCYERVSNDKFRVFDNSKFFEDCRDEDERLFSRILKFKGIDRSVVANEYRPLIAWADFVFQEPNKLHFVEFQSLNGVVDIAIAIYNFADKLKSLK